MKNPDTREGWCTETWTGEAKQFGLYPEGNEKPSNLHLYNIYAYIYIIYMHLYKLYIFNI